MGNCGSRGGLRMMVPLREFAPPPVEAGNYGSRGGLRVIVPIKKPPAPSPQPATGGEAVQDVTKLREHVLKGAEWDAMMSAPEQRLQ